ncbi:RHS repeat-associated core domain-containing protein [Streptomyces sp. NPDC101209]|uniref:RHS repeat-associated core domain-containing protein n=1 Tax=Streptomyces sp. NPDC101209 TaxID=3366129 RepID=UPI0037F59107
MPRMRQASGARAAGRIPARCEHLKNKGRMPRFLPGKCRCKTCPALHWTSLIPPVTGMRLAPFQSVWPSRGGGCASVRGTPHGRTGWSWASACSPLPAREGSFIPPVALACLLLAGCSSVQLGNPTASASNSPAAGAAATAAPVGRGREGDRSGRRLSEALHRPAAAARRQLPKMGAHYYDPELRRLTQPDPSGKEANASLYAAGDPVNSTDPAR